jgi:muramoyltetrapeptide carboxypeptidase
MPSLHRPMAGSEVVVVAPASLGTPERMERGLDALSDLGFSVTTRDGRPPGPRHYLASDDASRAAELLDAAGSDTAGMIWALRGGYGCIRTLEVADRERLCRRYATHRRPLIGFSDCTVLLNWLAQRTGVPTVHGPVVTQLPELTPEARTALVHFLSGPGGSEGQGVFDRPLEVLRGGEVTAPIYGGNLSVLTSLIGTPWFPSLAGAILFVEDVGEPTYRIDRFFTQLRLSGSLDGVAGLLFGQFSGVRGGDAVALADLQLEVALTLGVPALRGAPCGHEPDNHPFALGVPVHLRGDRLHYARPVWAS